MRRTALSLLIALTAAPAVLAQAPVQEGPWRIETAPVDGAPAFHARYRSSNHSFSLRCTRERLSVSTWFFDDESTPLVLMDGSYRIDGGPSRAMRGLYLGANIIFGMAQTEAFLQELAGADRLSYAFSATMRMTLDVAVLKPYAETIRTVCRTRG